MLLAAENGRGCKTFVICHKANNAAFLGQKSEAEQEPFRTHAGNSVAVFRRKLHLLWTVKCLCLFSATSLFARATTTYKQYEKRAFLFQLNRR